MLPAMTAAVLLAQRERAFSSGVAVAIATLAKQTGAATLLPVLYILWRKRGAQRREARARRVRAPARGRRARASARASSSSGRRSATAATSSVERRVAVRDRPAVRDDADVRRVQPADHVDAAPRAWRERKTLGRDDVDLWLWLLSATISVALGLRFFGHYYIQVLPPLVPPHDERPRPARAGASSTRPSRPHSLIAVPMTVAGFIMRPFNERRRVQAGQRVPQGAHPAARPHPRVGSAARDLLGVGRPPGDAVHHVGAAHGLRRDRADRAGAAGEQRAPGGGHARAVAVVLRGLRAAPAPVHPRRHPPADTRLGGLPDLARIPTSRGSSTATTPTRSTSTASPSTSARPTQPRRSCHPSTGPRPRSPLHQRPGQGVVARVGVRELPAAQEVVGARAGAPPARAATAARPAGPRPPRSRGRRPGTRRRRAPAGSARRRSPRSRCAASTPGGT